MEKNKRISLLIGGCVGLFILSLWWLGALQGLENKSLDFRFKLRGQVKPPESIAIVVVNEESIQQLGRWPWPRDVHGELVKRLTRAGAKSIVFDVLFVEPDTDHPLADKNFGRVIGDSGKVVLGSFYRKVTSEGVPVDLALPIRPLLKKSKTGFVNVYTELDGINRKIPLMEVSEQGEMVPSLALAALSQYLGKTPEQVLAEKKIPLNDYNEMNINFFGGFETFPYYQFHEVLKGKVPPEKFKDKIVLVGGTATALFDQKATPFSPVSPGMEIHANAISNILQGNYLRSGSAGMTFLLVIAFAFIPCFILLKFSPLKSGIATFLILAGYFLLTYALFVSRFMHAEFIAPASSLSLSFVGVMLYRFMGEEKEKRWIKKTFSHYLSAHVMESILSDPNSLRLGGQRQTLTVLFSDIRGFTTISEALNPEEVVELLNEYLSKMVEIVFKHDGTLDKFIGDAVMAFWGAPIAQKDHAKKAVLCAVEMIDELKKLQEKWKSEGKKIIDIGIGISTGEMIVGNMGSKEKMEYTVIGDNVNLGSRLESLNKEYKTHIIMSEATYREVQDIIDARPLGSARVKGKEKAVEIYEVVGKKA